MSTRKSSFFYGTLIALASLVSGMVIASKLDLAPSSFAGTMNVPATNTAPITGPIDSTTFRTIAHDQGPAVVSIVTTGKRVQSQDLSELFGFDIPGARPQGRNGNRPETFRGAGSGFIIDAKEGYILTNNHVVEDADDITIMLSNMTSLDYGLKAKLIGRDRLTDSALLKLVDVPRNLAEVKFADSTQIAAGDWVMAIGNPFAFANTVTVGVVSAVGRVSPQLNPMSGRDLEYIQTDAAINRGNSGGPLLNIRGEVVGINTAIISDQSGGNIGIGFAVPINTVRDVLPALRTGKVTRGRIGVSIDKNPMTPEDAKALGLPSVGGAIVNLVEDGTPAKAAGIQSGDVIVDFNGKPVKDSGDLVSKVSGTTPGTSVPVRVYRDGKPMTLTVKVAELNTEPEDELASNDRGRERPTVEEPTETGFGMSVSALTPRQSRALPSGKGGAVIMELDPSGAAARAGLAPGDVIVRVAGKEMSSVEDVTKALAAVTAGQSVRINYIRTAGGSGAEQFALLRKK